MKHTHINPQPHPWRQLQMHSWLLSSMSCSGMCWPSFLGRWHSWRVLLLVGQLLLWSVDTPSLWVFTEQWQTQTPKRVAVNKADLISFLKFPLLVAVNLYLPGLNLTSPAIFSVFYVGSFFWTLNSWVPQSSLLDLFFFSSHLFSPHPFFFFSLFLNNFINFHDFNDSVFSKNS